MKEKNGITLIGLVVTIIVILILAGITISSVTKDDGVINKASEASFKSDVSEIVDAWGMTLVKMIESGEDESAIEIFEDVDKREALNNISSEMLAKLEVQHGRLVYIPNMCTDKEKDWFEELGIMPGFYIDTIVYTTLKTESTSFTTEKPQGYDLVLVLDGTTSMNTNNRLATMITAVNKIINDVMNKSELNRIAVVTFGVRGSQKILLPLDRYTNSYFTGDDTTNKYIKSQSGIRISDNVKNGSGQTITPMTSTLGGSTNMQSGIHKGAQVLLSIPGTSAGSKYENNNPGIIVLTDGQPNQADSGYATLTGTTSTSGSSASGYTAAFYTILTAEHFKREINNVYKNYNKKELMFFTVGLDMSASSHYELLILDPSNTNMQTASTSSVSNAKNLYKALDNQISGLNNPFKDEKGFSYSDASSLGNFDSTQLADVFTDYTEQLGIDHTTEVQSTGVFETITVLEQEGVPPINVEIDENKNINIKVTAQLVDNLRQDENGKTLYDTVTIAGVDTKQEEQKSYTLTQIKSGIDPNLKFIDGKIVWYLRKEYTYTTGLAVTAKNTLTNRVQNYLNDNPGSVVEITKVEFEYFIKEK